MVTTKDMQHLFLDIDAWCTLYDRIRDVRTVTIPAVHAKVELGVAVLSANCFHGLLAIRSGIEMGE